MKMQNEPKPSFKVGPLLVDTYRKSVSKDGIIVPLSVTEFDVLAQLALRRGEVILREEFAPWFRPALEGDRHPVDDVVKELRIKLRGVIPIVTVHGRGYRLGAEVPVTEVAGPSVSASERLKAIALDRMNLFTLQSLVGSIHAYEEALRHGPDADAYANLAISYINQGHTGFCLDLPQKTIIRARDTLSQALDHYPEFSSAFALRGLTRAIYDYDWAGADADIKTAFAHNADDEYAHIIKAHLDVAWGRFDDGISHARRAAELDWRTPMTIFTVPWMLVLSNRAEEALSECEHAVRDFDPFAVGHIVYGYAWEALGVEEQAKAEYQKSLEIAEFPDAFGCLGHAYGLLGDRKTALSFLERLRTFRPTAYVSGWHEAMVYVGVGMIGEALEALERAFVQKCDWLIYLNVDARWKPLRGEPRFQELVNKVGLPLSSGG